MSESVDILIKAEDLATPVIKQSAKAVDGLDVSIKRTGEATKRSTDLLRALSSVLGGTQFGAAAGQLGELTEKTSQFATSGLGAVASRVGIIAAVGAVAVRVGAGIGSLVFETDKWTRSLALADEEAKRLNATQAKINAERFGESRADISILGSTEERNKANQELLTQTEQKIKSVSAAVKQGEKDVEGWASSWARFGADLLSVTSVDLTNNGQQRAIDQLATERSKLDVLQDQARELARMPRDMEREALGNARAYVKTLEDEVELLQVVEREREKVRALQAIPIAGPEQTEALRLVQLKEQLRVTELIRTETKRLQFEEMQLQEGGKERVDSLRLQEQGLAKEQADKIASEQTRIDRLKQGAEAKPLLQGKDERLLSRGTPDPAIKVAKEQLQELQSIGEILAKREEAKNPPAESTTFRVVQ
jgi:hypothetical protein